MIKNENLKLFRASTNMFYKSSPVTKLNGTFSLSFDEKCSCGSSVRTLRYLVMGEIVPSRGTKSTWVLKPYYMFPMESSPPFEDIRRILSRMKNGYRCRKSSRKLRNQGERGFGKRWEIRGDDLMN